MERLLWNEHLNYNLRKFASSEKVEENDKYNAEQPWQMRNNETIVTDVFIFKNHFIHDLSNIR